MPDDEVPLTAEEIRAVRNLLREPAPEEPSGPPMGLRERKKRATRQAISDTATMLFLTKGFDEVRVADVAEACGVSEKTVYNYFPTKESLVLDREDAMIETMRRALGPEAPAGSPVEAVVNELLGEFDLRHAVRGEGDDQDWAFSGVTRFRALVEANPSLRAAQRDMMDRITRATALQLANRAGVDPSDPEPYVAATAICALWGVLFTSMERQGARHADDRDAIVAAITEDVWRAARLIDTGLWSFGLQVQGRTSQRQVREAAAAARAARMQVMDAVAAAKDAWWKMTEEMRAFHDAHVDEHGGFDGPAFGWRGPGPMALNGGPPRRGDRRGHTEGRDQAIEAHARLDEAKQQMARAAKEVAKAKVQEKRATRNLKNAAKDAHVGPRPRKPRADS